MNSSTSNEFYEQWLPTSYSTVAKQYLPMAGRLVFETGIDSSDSVLDVGTGTGNVALSAARNEASVTGVDISPSMVRAAEENAKQLGYDDVKFEQGDVLELHYEEDSFDVTVSALGHIYGDPPNQATQELIRVTRPGGRIGVTSWTPTSLLPLIAGHVVSHLDPADQPIFSQPPFMWGDEAFAREQFTPGVSELSFETATIDYPTIGPMAFWEELSTHSGQLSMFLEKINDHSQLQEQVVDAIESHFKREKNAVELEYLITSGHITGN